MGRAFSNILVPIDFSANTLVAISKAVELSNSDDCTVHLLHIIRPKSFFLRIVNGSETAIKRLQAREKLKELKNELKKLRSDLQVTISAVVSNDVSSSIIKRAKRSGADLIIVSKSASRKKWLHSKIIPLEIAAESGIPVWMAKTGAINQRIRTVVIPVSSGFPANRLQLIDALPKNSLFHIRLVLFADDRQTGGFNKQTLLNTFQTLRHRSTIPVNYEVLQGAYSPESILAYCNKVDADLLVISPSMEAQSSGWRKSYLTDLIPPNSKTQLLAVKPG